MHQTIDNSRKLAKPVTYLLLIFIIAFMAAGVYLYKPISAGVEVLTQQKPCDEPLAFKIGSIDPRFAITEAEIINAARDAAILWNDGSELNLTHFEIDADKSADVVINFEYDERQERTDAEFRFRERIRAEQTRLDQLQQQHNQRRDRFAEESDRLRQLSESTTEELNRFNEWVSDKNESGGFTEPEYNEFTGRKADIERKQREILRQRERLDQMATTINREMDELNKKFAVNNRLVDRYNKEFAGDMRFTKATYQHRGGSGVITVNQFMNKRELRLILAHEMGHAIGVDHLSNPKSVMNSRMGAQDLYPVIQLTDEDRTAAHALCE